MKKSTRRSTGALLACISASLLVVQGLSSGAVAGRPPEPDVLIAQSLPLPGAGPVAARPSAAASAQCYDLPRATKDRPDLDRGRLVHVVYLVPSDSGDEKLDTKGILDCSVRAQNQWFQEASDGMTWRFDTFKTKVGVGGTRRVVEAADVTFVRSKLEAAALSNANAVAQELTALGFAHPEKRYLSYVASPAAPCGDAAYPIRTGGGWADGQYAQVYLFSNEACGAADFGVPGNPSFSEAIAQQELIHNDGLTSPGAPHGCLGGVPPGLAHVCTGPLFATEGGLNADPERVDVMYPFVSVPLSEKVLDRGNDDYFRHSLPHLFDFEDSPYIEPVAG